MICELFPSCDFPNWFTMLVEIIIGLGIAVLIFAIDQKNKKKTDHLSKQMSHTIQRIDMIIGKANDETNNKKKVFVKKISEKIEHTRKLIEQIEEIYHNSKKEDTSTWVENVRNRLGSVLQSLDQVDAEMRFQSNLCPYNLPDELERIKSDIDSLYSNPEREDFDGHIQNTVSHIDRFLDVLNERRLDF